MTCARDLYTNYLLSSTSPPSATDLSWLLSGAMNHDLVIPWPSSFYLNSKRVWVHTKRLVHWAEQQRSADELAVLIVGDFILEKKHTGPSILIYTHWNHGQGRLRKGLSFESLLCQVESLSLAVELLAKVEAIWIVDSGKPGLIPSTPKMSACVPYCLWPQQQVACRYLLAGTWYTSIENPSARSPAVKPTANKAGLRPSLRWVSPMSSPCAFGCGSFSRQRYGPSHLFK